MDSTILFQCPKCGQQYQSDAAQYGAETVCEKCGASLTIQPEAGQSLPRENELRREIEDEADRVQASASSIDTASSIMFILAVIALLGCFVAAQLEWGIKPLIVAAVAAMLGTFLKVLTQFYYIRASLLRIRARQRSPE